MKRSPEAKKQPRPSVVRDLLLLFSVPFVVLLVAAGVIYGPRAFANPHEDFLYVICSDYGRNCMDNYTVSSEGKLQINLWHGGASRSLHLYDYDVADPGTLYYYDVSKETSTRLTVDEARRYDLSRSEESSDGYRLKHYSTSSGFLFWGNSSSGWQLENGLLKKRIELAGNEYDDKQLIGWIKS